MDLFKAVMDLFEEVVMDLFEEVVMDLFKAVTDITDML